MRPLIIIFVMLFVANILLTGVFQSKTKKNNAQVLRIESNYNSAHAKHSILHREKQELLRRDRIVSYAQNHLNMELLKPDVIASGSIIKEIKEDVVRNNNIIYCFIDFITPSMNAFEIKK
jgi:hypothetical protein